MPADGRFPFFGRTDEGDFLELQWDPTWGTVATNSNGSSGWARVLRSSGRASRSSGEALEEGSCRRVHKCAHNPCKARWPASKYGLMGAPIHVQEVDREAVVFGPAAPGHAALRTGQIPLPAAAPEPQLRLELASVSTRGSVHSSGAHASGNQHEAVFSLGREIRTPRHYVGYSFFVAGLGEAMSSMHVGRKQSCGFDPELCTLGGRHRSGGVRCGRHRVLLAFLG